MSKICNICKEEKDYLEFNRYKASPDGYSYYCKLCSRARQRANYEKYTGRTRVPKKSEEQKKKERYARLLETNSSWGSGVYQIITKCGESYIGCSKSLKGRMHSHKCKNPRADSCIAGCYEVVEFKILEKIENYTRRKGKLAEQKWIDKLNPTLNQRAAAIKVREVNSGIEGLIEDIAKYYQVTVSHILATITQGTIPTRGPLRGLKLIRI